MPASRSARKGIKLGRTASAREYRLREEMGLSADRHADDPYVTPAERERKVEQRAALRTSFARLSPAERRRQEDDYRRRLRPLCLSRRAFVGAWTANFEPLLNGGGAEVVPPAPVRAPASTQPGRALAPARPAVKPSKPGRSPGPATSAPKPRSKPTRGKEARDAGVPVAAVQALLRELGPRDLASLRAAVGRFAAQAPPGMEPAVRTGVATIARALAAELRSRP